MELLPHTATLLLKKCQKNTLLLNYLEKKFRLFLNKRLKFSLWVLNQKLETVKRHVEKKRVPRTFPTSETLKAQMARKKKEISFCWESNLLLFKTTVYLCPTGYQSTFCLTLEITNFRTSQLGRCNSNLSSQSSQKVNIGFIRLKFPTRFPSKQQLSGSLPWNCQTTNLNFDRKIQFSLYVFYFRQMFDRLEC